MILYIDAPLAMLSSRRSKKKYRHKSAHASDMAVGDGLMWRIKNKKKPDMAVDDGPMRRTEKEIKKESVARGQTGSKFDIELPSRGIVSDLLAAIAAHGKIVEPRSLSLSFFKKTISGAMADGEPPRARADLKVETRLT